MKNSELKLFSILLLTTLVLLYYNSSKSKVEINYPNSILKISNKCSATVQKVRTLNLNLDTSLVVDEFTMLQYIPQRNELVMNDKNNNRLVIYQLTKKSIVEPKIIKLPKNKKGYQGFHFLSKDSIFLYDYSNHSLCLTNSTGVTINNFTFEDTTIKKTFDFNPSLPYISNTSPLIIDGDELLATGFMDGEHEKEVFLGRTVRSRLNMKTSEIKFDLTYPKIYEKRNWGGGMFRSVYSFYNIKQKLHILSFPADHNLTVVNEKNEIISFPAYSRVFSVSNQPVNLKKSELTRQKRHFQLNHFLDNASYRGILHDRFSQLYYRFTELPESGKNDFRKSKKTIMLILDEEFNYVTEFNLPEYLSSENSFITPEGIYFLNTTNKNENIAKYEQYKISRIDNNVTISNE
jgi:hypothetical protein